MRKMLLIVVAMGFFAASAAMGTNLATALKAKHTNKQVMGKAMKGGLCKKVVGGDASAEEKLQLLDMFVSLSENKPKKGDAKSWQAKTNALVVSAAKAVVGREGAGDALKKAANCTACHKAHK